MTSRPLDGSPFLDVYNMKLRLLAKVFYPSIVLLTLWCKKNYGPDSLWSGPQQSTINSWKPSEIRFPGSCPYDWGGRCLFKSPPTMLGHRWSRNEEGVDVGSHANAEVHAIGLAGHLQSCLISPTSSSKFLEEMLHQLVAVVAVRP